MFTTPGLTRRVNSTKSWGEREEGDAATLTFFVPMSSTGLDMDRAGKKDAIRSPAPSPTRATITRLTTPNLRGFGPVRPFSNAIIFSLMLSALSAEKSLSVLVA
jgi:hypothetical protein